MGPRQDGFIRVCPHTDVLDSIPPLSSPAHMPGTSHFSDLHSFCYFQTLQAAPYRKSGTAPMAKSTNSRDSGNRHHVALTGMIFEALHDHERTKPSLLPRRPGILTVCKTQDQTHPEAASSPTCPSVTVPTDRPVRVLPTPHASPGRPGAVSSAWGCWNWGRVRLQSQVFPPSGVQSIDPCAGGSAAR